MIGPVVPIYQWGQKVVAAKDLFNDGSYPELDPDALIVPDGRIGEIVQVGTHVDTNTAVYMVEFGPRVVGCLEHEIVAAG
ncbi:MAG TPA: nitrogen fixation protein NifZ [Fibrobacteria bacterium]|nr:nitrogen fixation protein NifZ [Fibrobacteria bacterium]